MATALLSGCTIDSRITSLDSSVAAISSVPRITFILASVDFEENMGTAIVEIHSDRALTSDLSFTVDASGNAVAADYSFQAPGTAIKMVAGNSSTQIKISIVDDTLIEPAESIILSLPSSDQYILGSNSQIQVNINASDQPVCDPALNSNFGGGQGTIVDPYRICSIGQWNYFSTMTALFGSSFKLESDLDFSTLTFAQVKKIGDAANPFTGTFDGNNFAIKNINVNGAGAEFGLFNRTGGNVTIKNLVLKDITYTSTLMSAVLIHIHLATGTLTLTNITVNNMAVGPVNSGLVSNAKGPMAVSNITINGFTSGCETAVGIIVGLLEANGSFSSITGSTITINTASGSGFGGIGMVGLTPISATVNTISFADITLNMTLGQGPFTKHAGALAGWLQDVNVTVSNANISGTFSGRDIGGLIGSLNEFSTTGTSLLIDRSRFDGSISSGNLTGGGLVGYTGLSVTIRNSFSKGTYSATSGQVGGFIGQAIANTYLIEDSYSTAAISSSTSGKSSGIAFFAASTTVTIKNTYFAGSATSASGAVGCIAAQSSGTLTATDVYYDSTTCVSGAVNSGAFAGVTAVNTASLQTATPFPNWLSSVWTFAASTYPKLIWEP